MKRTQVAREVRDELHATEAALEEMITKAEGTLARMLTAKTELGLTGTVGDAATARLRETILALYEAREALFDSHHEAYGVMKATNIRGVAIYETIPSARLPALDAERAA